MEYVRVADAETFVDVLVRGTLTEYVNETLAGAIIDRANKSIANNLINATLPNFLLSVYEFCNFGLIEEKREGIVPQLKAHYDRYKRVTRVRQSVTQEINYTTDTYKVAESTIQRLEGRFGRTVTEEKEPE